MMDILISDPRIAPAALPRARIRAHYEPKYVSLCSLIIFTPVDSLSHGSGIHA